MIAPAAPPRECNFSEFYWWVGETLALPGLLSISGLGYLLFSASGLGYLDLSNIAPSSL